MTDSTTQAARQHMDTTNGTNTARHIPAEHRHRIMHAYLVLPDNRGALMGGASMPGMPYEGMKGFFLALSYPTAQLARSVFDALAKAGKVTMPMQPAFWAETWGMLTDRFGTPWAVNGALLPMPQTA